MAIKILRASCDTNNPETGNADWVNYIENSSLFNPNRLTVFVGQHKKGQRYDIMTASGGLLAPQRFKWENFPTVDKHRYYLLPKQASVTLEVHLEPTVGANASTSTTFDGSLPSDALAINLGTRYSNGTIEDFPDEDEWGKLVYYDTGRLGRGFAFEPAAYFPTKNSTNTLGFYMMGGAVPDYEDTTIAVQLPRNISTINMTSSINFQIGRDLSLLNQMNDTNQIGISGYWSVGYENIQGSVIGNKDGRVDQMDISIPAWMNFGLPTVGYPSSVTKSGNSVTYPDSYWPLVNPIYGKPCTQGNNRWGNCISIAPSAFFTNAGQQLFTDISSNPSGANGEVNSRWTTYFATSTSTIVLKETQPLSMEAPILNGNLPLLTIPNVESGLSMLVPVTRVMNGVILYNNYADTNKAAFPHMMLSHSSISTGEAAANYTTPEQGLLYLTFNVKYVKMTINLPVERIDTAKQTASYFHTGAYNGELNQNFRIWLRWFMSNDNEPLNSTIKIEKLNGQQVSGNFLEFRLTTKQILQKLMEAMKLHNMDTTNLPLNGIQITDTIVSCTTKPNLYQLYSRLLATSTYLETPQGSIMRAGGTKVFTRNGPNLSYGKPDPVTVSFYDVINDLGEIQSDNTRMCSYEAFPTLGINRISKMNDYFTHISHNSIDNKYPELRWPNFNDQSDFGGVVVIHCNTHACFNLPWCGPFDASINGGGVKLNGSPPTATAESFSNYAAGWFNNYNPFSVDFNQTNLSSTIDSWVDLDSRIVDFTARSVEVWLGLKVTLPVYSGDYLATTNSVKDDVLTKNVTTFSSLK